jgi:hypothetical protein
VKAIGTGMLALPRSNAGRDARESPTPMLIGMALLASGCLALGLFPSLVASDLRQAVRATGNPVDPLGDGVTRLDLAGVRGGISPVFIAVGLLAGVVAVGAALRALGAARARRRAENWGCGRVLQSARMEYTATSFAEPLQRVFDDVIHPDHDIDVSHADESRWYVDAVRYHLEVDDGVDRRVYLPVVRLARAWGDRARALQNGSVHRYLAYGFIGLLVVLVVAR